jgi:SAM-dependent methyltransferase
MLRTNQGYGAGDIALKIVQLRRLYLIVLFRARPLLERLPLPHWLKWRFSRKRFQPFNYTLNDRYPWLFTYARDHLPPDSRLLSFGCSTGEEIVSLKRYLPTATVRGIDVDPRNIKKAHLHTSSLHQVEIVHAKDTSAEPANSYDAVFCLAVLCNGYLTANKCRVSEPFCQFSEFELAIADFTRCLKPGGLLFLLTTNFRFCDTASAKEFDTVFAAQESNLAPDLIYDANNKLIEGERYIDAVFRKRVT